MIKCFKKINTNNNSIFTQSDSSIKIEKTPPLVSFEKYKNKKKRTRDIYTKNIQDINLIKKQSNDKKIKIFKIDNSFNLKKLSDVLKEDNNNIKIDNEIDNEILKEKINSFKPIKNDIFIDKELIEFNEHQEKYNIKINKLKNKMNYDTKKSNLKRANDFINNIKNKKIKRKKNKNENIKDIKYYSQVELENILKEREEEIVIQLRNEFEIILNNLKNDYEEIITAYQDRDKHLCASYLS